MVLSPRRLGRLLECLLWGWFLALLDPELGDAIQMLFSVYVAQQYGQVRQGHRTDIAFRQRRVEVVQDFAGASVCFSERTREICLLLYTHGDMIDPD